MTHEDALERFENLVAQYGHVIRAAVRRVAGPAADTLGDDAEQRVLIALWKQVQKEQIIEFPSSYLYKAAVRETIRLARRARNRSGEDLETVHIPDEHPDSQPERRVRSRELSERLRQVASGLLEDRRTAVVAHLAGYDVQEIMETEDWTYNRARNLIARGMADLRRALEADDDP